MLQATRSVLMAILLTVTALAPAGVVAQLDNTLGWVGGVDDNCITSPTDFDPDGCEEAITNVTDALEDAGPLADLVDSLADSLIENVTATLGEIQDAVDSLQGTFENTEAAVGAAVSACSGVTGFTDVIDGSPINTTPITEWQSACTGALSDIPDALTEDLERIVGDPTPPMLDEVELRSNNTKTGGIPVADQLAIEGDTLTLYMNATDTIEEPTVTLFVDTTDVSSGVTVASTDPDERDWTATYVVAAGLNGEVTFNIEFQDPDGIEGDPVDETTDGSEVIVDTEIPTAGVTYDPVPVNDVIELEEGQNKVTVDFTLSPDTDVSASDAFYTMDGGSQVPIILSDGTFDVPAFNGLLEITFDLEDEAGNQNQDTFSVTVVPFTPPEEPSTVAITIFEGGKDAEGEVRFFGPDQERTYTVTVTHSGDADPVGAVVLDFTIDGGTDGLELVSISEQDALVFTEGDFLSSIELDPYVVDDETRAFQFTVTGVPLFTGSEVVITVEALTSTFDPLGQVQTTAKGDHDVPSIGSWAFPADANDDGAINRTEFQAVSNQILLEVTGLSDAESGVASVEVRLIDGGSTVLDSSTVADGETVATLELQLADLSPGLNNLEIAAFDKVGNEATEAVELTIEIHQFIVVKPGVTYMQPGGSQSVEFNLTQENFVDEVVRYDLRATRADGTADFLLDGYADTENTAQVGKSSGSVRLVRYSAPDPVLDVDATLGARSGVPDGENFFTLTPVYNPSNADVSIVDADLEPYLGPVFTVIVDGTAPILHSATPSQAVFNADDIADGFTLTFDITEANPYTVTVTNSTDEVVDTSDGAPITIDTSALESGAYEFTVNVTDAAGNEAVGIVVTITVDVDEPDLVFTDLNGFGSGASFEVNASNAATNDGNLNFTFTATDTGPTSDALTVELLQDGAVEATVGGDATWITIPVPADTDYSNGPLSFALRATDGAGNVNETVPIDVHIDTTAPVVAFQGIVEDTDGNLAISASEWHPTLNFTVDVNDGSGSGVDTVVLEVSDGVGGWDLVAGQDYDGALGILEIPTPASGIHTYRFVATDMAGNVNDGVEVTVTVDDSIPTISLTDLNGLGTGPSFEMNASNAAANDGNLNFTFSATNGDSGLDTIGLVQDGTVVASVSGSETWISIPLPADTDYGDAPLSFSLRVHDNAGNVNETDPFDVRIDTAAPDLVFLGIVEDVNEDGVISPDEREAELTFQLSVNDGIGSGVDDATVRLQELVGSDWVDVAGQDYNSTAGEIVIDTPVEGGEKTYRLTAGDNAGNVAVTSSIVLTIAGEAEITLDMLSQDGNDDGTLNFTEIGVSLDLVFNGTKVPADGAGCPCTYELVVLKDGLPFGSPLTGSIAQGVPTTETITLSGSADGAYTATVRMLGNSGETLASASDAATVAIQPMISGFTVDMEGVGDIAGDTSPTTSGAVANLTTEFQLNATRAGLSEAAITSPLGFTTAEPGMLDANEGLIVEVADDGSSTNFKLFLDSTGDAPHQEVETFTLSVTGAAGLDVLFEDAVDAFSFIFDKDVDLLTAAVTQTDLQEATVTYTARDDNFGLGTVELFHNGDPAGSDTYSADTSEQTGAFTLGGLPDGEHVFTVVATDEAGNTRDESVSIVINDHAEVTVELLQDGEDRMDGTLSIRKDQTENLVLRVSNAEDDPTVTRVTLFLSGGDSAVQHATGWNQATTSGGLYTVLRFFVEVPGGETVDRAFSLRMVDGDATGTWTVHARTAAGLLIDDVNEGADTVVIQTPATVTPDVAVAASQGGVPLESNATGVLFATVDGVGIGDFDDSDEVTFTAIVTDSGTPIEGATVTFGPLGWTGQTNETGAVTFTVDPDDHGFDFQVTEFTFTVEAAEMETGSGGFFDLAEASESIEVLWTGFYVRLTGDVEAPIAEALPNPAEITAALYWLHDVIDTVTGDLDFSGATAIPDGDFDGTINLLEDVGATGLDPSGDGLDGTPGEATRLFQIERGNAGDASGAGFRQYTANLTGDLPMDVGRVFASDEHRVLFSSVRLILDPVEHVAFVADTHTITVSGQWLHEVDFDGGPIDRFDLSGYSNITLGGSIPGTLPSASNTVEATVPAVAGTQGVSVSGSWSDPFQIFPANTQLFGLEAAFGLTPANETLLIGADYAGDFNLTVNGLLVDEGFTLGDETLTTTRFGLSATDVTFEAATINVAGAASVLFDGEEVAGTDFAYNATAEAWEFTLPSPAPGIYTLVLDLELGSLDGQDFTTTLEADFSVIQEAFRVTLTDVLDANDNSTLSEIWVDRNGGPVTLEFLVEKGEWDGETLASSTLGDNGVEVQLWVDTGTGWALDETQALSEGDGTGSFSLAGFELAAAGVKQVRIVVTNDTVQDFTTTDGQNPQTIEAGTTVLFTGITASFLDSGDVTALAGNAIPVGVLVTYDHDGSPVPDVNVTFSGTGIDTLELTTNETGHAVVSLVKATPLLLEDLAAAINVDTAPSGLTHATGNDYNGDLRWVVVKIGAIEFFESPDGSDFQGAGDVDGTKVTVDSDTFVRVNTTIVLNDGTGETQVDGGLIRYGTRNIALDDDGVGTRVYFSSQAGTLQVTVTIVETTLDGETFLGGAGDSFTIEWESS